jgi:hypothetical protein
MPYATCHKPYTTHIMLHIPQAACVTPHTTCHITHARCLCHMPHAYATCHMPHATCHMSHATCHMPHATCYNSNYCSLDFWLPKLTMALTTPQCADLFITHRDKTSFKSAGSSCHQLYQQQSIDSNRCTEM